jgi:hypothetical protein
MWSTSWLGTTRCNSDSIITAATSIDSTTSATIEHSRATCYRAGDAIQHSVLVLVCSSSAKEALQAAIVVTTHIPQPNTLDTTVCRYTATAESGCIATDIGRGSE